MNLIAKISDGSVSVCVCVPETGYCLATFLLWFGTSFAYAMTMATLSHFGRRCVVGVDVLDAKSTSSTSALTVRLTDDDNYMLKSASLQSDVSLRPRSASLSHVSSLAPSCGRQTLPVTTKPAALFNSSVLQQVASSTSTSLPYKALICSCLPGCCCKCCLLSSVAECQAVYHHVCARVASSTSTSPTSELTTVNGCTGVPMDADQLPPPTVPQDVVSLYPIQYFSSALRSHFSIIDSLADSPNHFSYSPPRYNALRRFWSFFLCFIFSSFFLTTRGVFCRWLQVVDTSKVFIKGLIVVSLFP